MPLVLLPCVIHVKILKVNLLWGNTDQVVSLLYSGLIYYVVHALQSHFYSSNKH